MANDLTIMYIAFFAFIFAVLFELWRRTNNIGRAKKSAALSDRMEKAMHYLTEQKKRKRITNDAYQKLTGVSDSTATRDLRKLAELGFLEQRGRTSKIYYLFTPKIKTHKKTHAHKRRGAVKKKK